MPIAWQNVAIVSHAPSPRRNDDFDHLERIGRNRLGMDGYEHRRRNILGPNFRDTSRNAGSS
jgi:hypothetical protein